MGFVDGRLSDGVGPDRLVQGKFRSPVSSLRSIVYEGGQIFTANKNDGIISFFPLTFRSFLSSSFSFLFYNNTRLGINVKLSWPNRKMPRFVLTNGILTNATKGTVSRSFRATFPSSLSSSLFDLV